VHWTDVDTRDGDLRSPQELEERLERTQRRGLDVHALATPVERLHDGLQILHDLFLHVVLVVVWPAHQQARAGDGLFEIRGHDLDTHGSFDERVMDVLSLHSQLLQRLWR